MGFLSRVVAERKTLSTYDVFRGLIAGRVSNSGKTVSVDTAIQVSTVFACCRVIGEGLAQVPLKLMQETGSSRLPAKKHPLYDILAFRPNSWQTSFEYREMLAWHLVLCGDHFSYKVRSTSGAIIELVPFTPQQVTVNPGPNWSLTYDIRAKDGSVKTFKADEIWHVRGPSWDGWKGLKAVELAREAIGLGMATEEASARLHRNGVRPSGAYSVEGTLTTEQQKKLSDWLADNAGGIENTGKPLVLDRAAKWLNTQMTGVDAQSLETRRFQIEEMCRFARVLPIMVGAESKNTTYASAEQMFLAHVVHTLAPFYQRIEQSIDMNLLSDKDRAAGLYSCFVEEGLLRGSMAETAAMLDKYVNGGLMTPNEGRAKLDLNPDADPASNKLRVPANIVGKPPAQGAANA